MTSYLGGNMVGEGGESVNVNVGSRWNADLAGASQTEETAKTTFTSTRRRHVFTDSQSTGDATGPRRYEAYAYSPRIPKPPFVSPKTELFQKEESDSTPPPGGRVSQQSFGKDKDFVTLIREFIQSNEDLSQDEKAAALSKFFVPGYRASSKVSEALSAAVSDARAKMLETDPSWVQPSYDPQVFNVAYSEAVEGAFASAIASRQDSGKPVLTEEQLGDMEYALYHPDKASSQAKALLKELGISSTIKEILSGAGLDIPEVFVPDSGLYDIQLNEKGDLKFEATVDAYAKEHNLTIEQGYQLKTAYYNPGSTSLSEELTKALEGIKKDALNGMPSGWDSEPNAKLWNGIISANYRNVNESLLSEYMSAHPRLTTDDAVLLRKAINGETEGIPDNILKAAASIKAKALLQIQAKYGVDETWVPLGSAISATQPSGVRFASLKTLSDLQSVITKYINKLPEPQRVLATDSMKSVSEALSILQETIYRMEVSDAEGQKDLSVAQQEAQEQKIKLRQEELKKQEAEQAKVEKKKSEVAMFQTIIQIVTPIIAVISIVATIASFGTLGPLAVGLIVLMTTASCVDMIPGVDGKMSEWTMNIIGTLIRESSIALGADPKKAKWADFVGKLVTVLLVVLATKGAGAQSAILTSTQYFSSSNLIADPLVAQDVDPLTTAIVSGSVNAGVSLGALCGCALIKSTGTITADTLNASAKAFSDAAAASTNIVQRAFYNAMAAFYRASAASLSKEAGYTLRYISRTITAMQVTNSGLQAGQGAYEYELSLAQGNLALIKKMFESKDIAMRDLIEALKAQVQKLLQILSELMKWLPSVGETQAGLWEKNRTPMAAI